MHLRPIHEQGVPSAGGLGFVDLDLEFSTVCPFPPRLMGIWQKRLGSCTRLWNTQIKVNPTQVHDHMDHLHLVLMMVQGDKSTRGHIFC